MRLAPASGRNRRNLLFTMLKGLLRSSQPVLVVTALVAILGVAGTAYGAKLITSSDIKDGSIAAVDLSKNTRAGLVGTKGATGAGGHVGVRGPQGFRGSAGAHGATSNVPGPAGPQGVQGSIGPTGATSSVAGPQGTQGIQGPTGAPGAASTVAGPPGSPGAPGAPGAPGSPGANATAEGAPCVVPGPLTGTFHWSNQFANSWVLSCLV
jgi:hypothetical protein